MDFAFTDTQEDLAALTRRIVSDLVTDDALRRADQQPDRFDTRLWRELATAGVLGVALPDDVGGGGCGVVEQCRALVELGRGVAPVPMVSAIAMGAAAVAEFGSAEQRDRWARPAAAGDVVLTAALVEEGQPEPTAPTTRAERTDDGWLLTGTKTTVPAGMIADAVLVPASTEDGAAVFLVPTDSRGLTRERQVVVDADSEALLTLQQTPVTSQQLVGRAGQGAEVVRWVLDRGVLGLCALQLGTVERALEMTAEYAKERVQFGRPVGSFQAVSQRIADAYIDVEGVRLTLWQAAWRMAEGLDCDAELATAKFWAAEGGHRVAHTAVHIHGGVGIDRDYPLHRYFVAAKRNEFALGAATEQLRRLGTLLADEPA
ncbi:MAG TPA: acyl-CoA dehydrogenase family protein [Nocardioidaceae bacterium]|nr:acyl-CoA dehydrogenase family protein [Nocardioidaceae bacterium]